MSQLRENHVSEEDRQSIHDYELGDPIATFRIKAMYIYAIYTFSIFCFALGIIILFMLLLANSLGWYKAQIDSSVLVAAFLLLPGSCLSFGVVLLRVMLPNIQIQQLIICEQGLLEVTRQHGYKQIEIVYWRDIVLIRRYFGIYWIKMYGRKLFALDTMYDGIGEIIALIRTKSGRKRALR